MLVVVTFPVVWGQTAYKTVHSPCRCTGKVRPTRDCPGKT
jgi:hypothetical protein